MSAYSESKGITAEFSPKMEIKKKAKRSKPSTRKDEASKHSQQSSTKPIKQES